MANTVTRKLRQRVGILAVVFVGVFFFHTISFFNPLEHVVLSPFIFVQTYVYKASVFFHPSQGTSVVTDEATVRELQSENAKLKAAVALSELAQTQLDLLKSQELTGVVANVIARDDNRPQDVLIVNKGEKEGVRVGNAAIGQNGAFVGVVSKVNDHTANVHLITSPDLLVSASVENGPRSTGVVGGTFGTSLQMDYIPQFDDVQKGQIVSTNGREPGIPAGLLIGTVQDIQSNPGTLFQRGIITAFTDPQKTQIITIVHTP